MKTPTYTVLPYGNETGVTLVKVVATFAEGHDAHEIMDVKSDTFDVLCRLVPAINEAAKRVEQ